MDSEMASDRAVPPALRLMETADLRGELGRDHPALASAPDGLDASARSRGESSARKDDCTARRKAPHADLQRTWLAPGAEALRSGMTRPSQSRPRCGNCDASLSSSPTACDLDRPADGGHASGAPVASSGNDARHNEGWNAEPHPGTPSSNNDDLDRTRSRCRRLDGNDRIRSDGNRDGGARPRPPSAWTSPPAGGILLFWGVIPQAFRRWAVTLLGVAPAGLSILPPATLLARDDVVNWRRFLPW